MILYNQLAWYMLPFGMQKDMVLMISLTQKSVYIRGIAGTHCIREVFQKVSIENIIYIEFIIFVLFSLCLIFRYDISFFFSFTTFRLWKPHVRPLCYWEDLIFDSTMKRLIINGDFHQWNQRRRKKEKKIIPTRC